jgi:hypothetical protein
MWSVGGGVLYQHDPQWNTRYRARRDAGDRHVAALRRLFSLMLGKLHHCLTTGAVYDPRRSANNCRPPLDTNRW